MTTTATRTCNAVIGVTRGEWGFEPVICRQSVGVRTYVTTGEVRVGYCPIPGHAANVKGRFIEAQDPPEPEWLHEHPADATYEFPEGLDPITAAKGELARWGA